MSKIHMEPDWVSVKPSDEYVYIHLKATDGQPFYVGKGTGRRAFSRDRSEFWKRRAAKHGVVVSICQEGLTRDDAILLEMWLIAKLRHEGYDLCNITDGGEGTRGYNRPRTDAERVKLRNAKGATEVCCSNGMVFGTCRDAAEWASLDRGAKCFPSAINLACCGGINMAYGYSWWRMGDEVKEVIDGRKVQGEANKIGVSSSDGMTHDSASDAAIYMASIGFTKASSSAISAACRGRIGSAYGRSWWYSGDEPKPYIPRYERSAASNRKVLT